MRPLSPVRAAALFILSVLSVLSVLSGPHAQAQDPLSPIFQDYLEHRFRQRPVEATRLGDHRFDHLVDDLSRQAREGWTALDRRTLEDLPRRVDYAKLPRSAQIDFEIFQHDLATSLWLTENTRPFEDDPRIYNEYLTESVFVLLTQSTLPKEANITNCLARMEQLPRVVEAAKANLRNPPRQLVETAIRQNRGAISFYETEIVEVAGETLQVAALKESGKRVAACLRDYQTWLEKELLPRASGEWRLGKEKFYRKLEMEMDAGMTADQVLADARTEFDRVEREMYTVARQLWGRCFPKQSLPPDDTAGRRSTIQQVVARIGQDHGKPETLVADVRAAVDEVKQFISGNDILRLPNPDRCTIIEMPEFQRGNSTAYMNSPPPLDPKASGYYAVSPPPKDWDVQRVNSYLEEYNHQMLRILTIHEAYPGHYVQFEYSNHNPSFIRRVLQSGAFIEGWAVYTEQTMLDQGFGQGDLALRLTQLKFYLRAVANAILDHNMHCTAMPDEEALKFLVEDAFQSEGEARLKIIRAKQSSVQLSTYFVGRMAMYRLRQAVQRELGAQFDLGRYHEAVLEHGPVPVKYLGELVRTRLSQPR